MGSLITYTEQTRKRFVEVLQEEFSRENIIYVIEKPASKAEGEFFMCAPLVTETATGRIQIRDTFISPVVNIEYGDSISIFKAGIRRKITVYSARKKLIINKEALKKNSDNIINEVDELETVAEIKEIPATTSNETILNVAASAIRRILCEDAMLTDDVYKEIITRKPWVTNIFDPADIDQSRSISKEEQFRAFVIYRVTEMLRTSGKVDTMMRPMYEFKMMPIYGVDSSICVRVDICSPLSAKRPLGKQDIVIDANHDHTTLSNTRLEDVSKLFKDCIPS